MAEKATCFVGKSNLFNGELFSVFYDLYLGLFLHCMKILVLICLL